jgi:hypothetical protein
MDEDGVRQRQNGSSSEGSKGEEEEAHGLELLERRTDSYLIATSGAVLGGDIGSLAAPMPETNDDDDDHHHHHHSSSSPLDDEGEEEEKGLEPDFELQAEEELGEFRKRPDQQSNWFARMVFSWVSPIVHKGHKDVLQNEVSTHE